MGRMNKKGLEVRGQRGKKYLLSDTHAQSKTYLLSAGSSEGREIREKQWQNFGESVGERKQIDEALNTGLRTETVIGEGPKGF